MADDGLVSAPMDPKPTHGTARAIGQPTELLLDLVGQHLERNLTPPWDIVAELLRRDDVAFPPGTAERSAFVELGRILFDAGLLPNLTANPLDIVTAVETLSMMSTRVIG